MNRIYLCEKAENIRNVYFDEERVYTKAEVMNSPETFKNTEYVFSTWGMPAFTEEEIKKYLPKLKAVFYGAGSVQTFARPFLNCGVKVFSAWAANAVPVAEYTVAQIVLANKGFFSSSRLAKTGDRKAASQSFCSYPGNYGVKIGIIGAGMIGKLVIQMLKSYSLEVLVFDPFLSEEKACELGVKKVNLEALFKECSVVSNHLADNEQTKGMLDGKLFEAMRPYATFINTGRGAQVVEADLIKVLKERFDITALLDVTFPEPPESESELYALPNCILTPHIAGSAGNEVRRMGKYMTAEYEKLIQNKPCTFEVTLEMLKTMA
ncbi:MAG: hydroxyacid dehydrogenase [Ruminococcaceae bacterium]|nr:hydroxyacid dehydrogenase [Oscillospiraceae bacterium]